MDNIDRFVFCVWVVLIFLWLSIISYKVVNWRPNVEPSESAQKFLESHCEDEYMLLFISKDGHVHYYHEKMEKHDEVKPNTKE